MPAREVDDDDDDVRYKYFTEKNCVCKSKLMVIAFLFFHYSHIIKLSPINITTKYNAYVMYVH